VLAGEFSIKDISSYLIYGQYFIAEKVGIPNLVPIPENSDDHMLHEFVSTDLIEQQPASCIMNKKRFINMARTAKNLGWFRNLRSIDQFY
jgi:hypothetical protein